jgi:Domain of unknown function (DUF4190)
LNMKRCPNCDRTFDDAMRFCQTDGTPLVDAPEPVDPYKTMVARPEDIAAAIPKMPDKPQPEPRMEEEVLEIPPVEVPDPKKTMYASEAEIRNAMAEVDSGDNQVIDVPPLHEPEPPRFIEPALGSPGSPFSDRKEPQTAFNDADNFGSQTTPPIPSPFEGAKREFGRPPVPDLNPEPLNEPKPFAEPERPAAEPPPSPFAAAEPPSSPLAQADPMPTPAAQDTDWQDNKMQNPQFQNAAGAAQNKTLAIVSLVIGILGTTLCCGTILPSLIAIVLGFMARGKANSNPSAYGGSGLAVGGIITGVIGLLLGLAYWVFLMFFGGMDLIMREMPR